MYKPKIKTAPRSINPEDSTTGIQRAKTLVISKKSYNRSITSQSGNLDRKTVVCYGRNKR